MEFHHRFFTALSRFVVWESRMKINGNEFIEGTCPGCGDKEAHFEWDIFAHDDGAYRHRDFTCPKERFESKYDWDTKNYGSDFYKDHHTEKFIERQKKLCHHCGKTKAEHPDKRCNFVLVDHRAEEVKKEQLLVNLRKMMQWEPEAVPAKIRKAYEENGAEPGEVPPFFSEVYLYELLGKEDARTLLAMFRMVLRSVTDLGVGPQRLVHEL